MSRFGWVLDAGIWVLDGSRLKIKRDKPGQSGTNRDGEFERQGTAVPPSPPPSSKALWRAGWPSPPGEGVRSASARRVLLRFAPAAGLLGCGPSPSDSEEASWRNKIPPPSDFGATRCDDITVLDEISFSLFLGHFFEFLVLA
jgi:hypothetical protein